MIPTSKFVIRKVQKGQFHKGKKNKKQFKLDATSIFFLQVKLGKNCQPKTKMIALLFCTSFVMVAFSYVKKTKNGIILLQD